MNFKDYTNQYSNLVTFTPNKNTPIHRWYPLVEGYSTDFVKNIIEEQENKPEFCFDPFGGIGTTALTCYEMGIKCVSIESSPFFYDVSNIKINFSNLSSDILEKLMNKIAISLSKSKSLVEHPKLQSKTFFENSKREKWVFHQSASNGIFDIVKSIDKICKGDNKEYKKVFKISLATILQEVSNVFKNGKCLSYKKNWQEKKYEREKVHQLFLNHSKNVILEDLKNIDLKYGGFYKENDILFGDSRKKIKEISDGIDIVITSPPYLNSRDYTDIYRLELWMLGYVSTYKSEKVIRKSALTSHVQIQLPKVDFPKIEELEKTIAYLESDEAELWNLNIPNMVRGYFNDMQNLLLDLKSKLNPNAKLYINVSNSAYSNHIIEVDVIIAKAAELIGYRCEEIRIARPIKTSSQQSKKMNIDNMRESVIVLTKL
ncbi:DNA methyltransferase [Lutibacter maritimus]|uniref:site-specific DNA-methyltransferase (cytosine-N(4)-specific) n=1 Tax=Lutibacter maritimus TaxID=593133 RepID=A0A1I6NRU2_9FLAO|nr:DNA methyltransferase [Lutibacter maritimus]SFS30643.1 DNA methylase [Lutibacter maritimus]